MNVGALLHQTVSYRTKSGLDANGQATLADLVTVRARVQPSSRVLRTAEGSERVSSHIIYTETLIPMGAQVWVPGASTSEVGEAREVLQTQSSPRLHDAPGLLCKAVLG